MAIELKIPSAGESVSEIEIGNWLKKKGDSVQRDEPIVVLESDKASMELPAPAAGTITEVLKQTGDTVAVGEVIAYLEPGPAKTEPKAEPKAEPRVTPAAPRSSTAQQAKPATPVIQHAGDGEKSGQREEVVPMTKLRRTIAERLVQAQKQAALLTTFNEVEMSAVMALRKQFGESFQAKFGVKLGIMSFFVKACVEALKEFPEVNAEIRDTNIVYYKHYDIGLAVGTERGLVVPVLRNAERLSFSEVEKGIGDFAKRARENKLLPDELQGGTFTISNGGVYGSLLSTPIVNPPQSGVLGLHAIQERPVAREGAVVIRPMMYLALSYDHRLIDGADAVSFLKKIKDVIENPARMLIEV